MLFVLKKALSRLFFPLPLSILLLLAGLIVAWRGRRPRWTRALLMAGLILLVLCSTTASSNLLMRPLESRYPPLGPEMLAGIDWDAVHTIVVFSGCTAGFDNEPVTRQIYGPSLARLVEGIRLYNACPACKMVLSGGLNCDATAPVETLVNARFAIEFGVAPEDIVIEGQSLDTDDQARILKDMLGQEPFIVVTSASHMPRTMALLQAEGLVRAIPGPTDYATGLYGLFSRQAITAESFYPNGQALWNSERAIYEYLGLLYMWVRSLF